MSLRWRVDVTVRLPIEKSPESFRLTPVTPLSEKVLYEMFCFVTAPTATDAGRNAIKGVRWTLGELFPTGNTQLLTFKLRSNPELVSTRLPKDVVLQNQGRAMVASAMS